MPTWACVINRAVARVHQTAAPDPPAHQAGCNQLDATCADKPAALWDSSLHLPLFITASEHDCISSMLPGFVDTLLRLHPDGLPPEVVALRKPLRPLWISQNSHIVTNRIAQPEDLPFCPVVLISASNPEPYRRQSICLPQKVAAAKPLDVGGASAASVLSCCSGAQRDAGSKHRAA